MDLVGKRVLVLGLGDTGLSMARWAARERAASVRVADTRADPPRAEALRTLVPQAEMRFGAFDRGLVSDIDFVAISPGVPLASPIVDAARAAALPIVGDIELFARALPRVYAGRSRPAVLGVTGTNGKSTVTALAGALARADGRDCAVAGNIGPAALGELMARIDAGRLPEVWALELSSYQLEATSSLRCDAAAVLNLSEDHLDRYPSMREYGEAKARVLAGAGVQVLNREDAAVIAMRRADARVVTFGLDEPPTSTDYGLAQLERGFVLRRGPIDLFDAARLGIAGLHNAANALAAIALTETLGLSLDAMRTALASFRGLPHRVEPVAQVHGVRYFDDSKGTNVGSTVAALTGFARELAPSGGKVVLIAGGEGKGQDFRPLREITAQAARAVVLIGRDAERIAAVLPEGAIPIVRAMSLEEAVARAQALALAGDVVLLSPACASFDMFRDYKHRGERFAAAVEALPDVRRT